MADVCLGSESVRQYMIRTILNRYPHLELGEDMRAPVGLFKDGKHVMSVDSSQEFERAAVVAKTLSYRPTLGEFNSIEEDAFVGKYLHVYTCMQPFEENGKLQWLRERMGQSIECIDPETFDITRVLIDESVLNKFDVIVFRYGISV